MSTHSCCANRIHWYGLVALIVLSGNADQFSHYEAAFDLVTIIRENNSTKMYIDTLINNLIERDSSLQKSRSGIYSLINTYLRSPEYEETRIRMLMTYFTEQQLRELGRGLENPVFSGNTPQQVALVKKYEDLFKHFEALFIEYIHQKLK